MKIQKVTWSMGNDFSANLVCEHCGHVQQINRGYNDSFYHNRVIPTITCEDCGKVRSGVVPAIENNTGSIHFSKMEDEIAKAMEVE